MVDSELMRDRSETQKRRAASEQEAVTSAATQTELGKIRRELLALSDRAAKLATRVEVLIAGKGQV